MFIVKEIVNDSSSVRSVMLTFRPDGAGILFDACNYKHCAPNGTFLKRSPDSPDSLDSIDSIDCYSYLSATSGSTFVARRAGMNTASNATPIRKIDTPPKA